MTGTTGISGKSFAIQIDSALSNDGVVGRVVHVISGRSARFDDLRALGEFLTRWSGPHSPLADDRVGTSLRGRTSSLTEELSPGRHKQDRVNGTNTRRAGE